MEPLDADVVTTNKALEVWRQGDCVVEPDWFVFRTNPSNPLTADGAQAASQGVDIVESQVRGFMVVTQTCDLVRNCKDRPFVDVSPLVEVSELQLREIERHQRPNYAFIPSLAPHKLVADLDRVMTVEKSVVASWNRTQGCRNDVEARRLALALARKRARVAFPDDFVRFAGPLTKRLSSKHDKESPEGRALRALREIRVRAAPTWEAAAVSLTFWFIRYEEPTFEDKAWHVYLKAWEELVPAKDRFVDVEVLVQTLDDLTATDYVQSDPLDLDHLTTREA